MTIPNLHGRYFCERCMQRFEGSGNCPVCPDEEPLLDLGDWEVRGFLVHQDQSRATRRHALYIAIGTVPAIAVAGVSMFWVGGVPAMFLGAGLAMGVAWALGRMFPPAKKTPALTAEELASFDNQAPSGAEDGLQLLGELDLVEPEQDLL
jgi:hypothetical protein